MGATFSSPPSAAPAAILPPRGMSSPALVICGPDAHAAYLFADESTPLGTLSTDLWSLDIPTGNWSLLNPTSPVSEGHSKGPRRLTCLDNILYAALADGTFAEFEIDEGTWSSPSQPPSTLSCAVPVILDSSVGFIGAEGPSEQIDVTQFFNPANGSWIMGQPYPHAVNRAGSAVIGSTAYMFGGFGGRDFYGDLNKLDSPDG
ncbi:hypothetical protein BDK51DRAFT_30129 [Blyttiomyces helicus]|uniref:Galactose oxidase n=1 Tax=Blyttiomyces helicus TaxID=388810 RepID=A0A4P9WFD0_9FUNG|nr:hypothetical protein BDK51DRAFT_30129 [Blyttiomyces helicus]|eukprot:RKO89136.1 hypothetical protein BDK51DRAFT_30129 [Blyttiomyces helicus]